MPQLATPAIIVAALDALRGNEVTVTSRHAPAVTGIYSGHLGESAIFDGPVRVTVPFADITSVKATTYASAMTDEQIRSEIGEARARLAGQLDDGVRVCVQARLTTVMAEKRAREQAATPMATLTPREITELQDAAKAGDADSRDLLWLYSDAVLAEQTRLVRAEAFIPANETWSIIRDMVTAEEIAYVVTPEMNDCEVLDAIEQYVRDKY